VTDDPEKDRVPTRRGRDHGPNDRYLLGSSTAPGPSPPTVKVLTDNASRQVQTFSVRYTAKAPPSGSGRCRGRRAASRDPTDPREARPPGRAGNDGGGGGAEAVPSAGWRAVAVALDAGEGQGHR